MPAATEERVHIDAGVANAVTLGFGKAPHRFFEHMQLGLQVVMEDRVLKPLQRVLDTVSKIAMDTIVLLPRMREEDLDLAPMSPIR